MNIIGFLITSLIIFIVVMLLVLIIVFRREIHSFFFPSKWVSITMIELDDNISSWLEKKNKDLTMQFNNGIYNLFDPVDKNNKLIRTIFKEGRLSKLFFQEGNPNPIDPRKQRTYVGDPQLTLQREKIQIARLFTGDKSLGQDLLEKYGGFLLIGILVLVVILLMK